MATYLTKEGDLVHMNTFVSEDPALIFLFYLKVARKFNLRDAVKIFVDAYLSQMSWVFLCEY